MMSAAPLSTPLPRDERRRGGVAEARAGWAGSSIAVMWLTVCLVSLFGGDIHSADGSTVPSGVALALFALLATLAVARWGLRDSGSTDALRAAIDDERRERRALAAEVAELRARQPTT
jgi:hypothetical protein